MDEREFADSIDCRFPYDDAVRSRRIVADACAISPNAVFAVIHELARPPGDSPVDPSRLLATLEEVARNFEHPLSKSLIGVARRMIEGDVVTVPESVALMRQISEFPGLYAALSTAYMCCDDRDGLADQEYNRIRESWEAA